MCWDVEPRSHDPKKELIPPPHVIQTTYMSGRDNEHRSGRDNEHRSGRDNEHRSRHSTSLSTSKTWCVLTGKQASFLRLHQPVVVLVLT